MTKIIALTDYDASVSLVEYNNVKASLQFSELSAKRLRVSAQKIVKVGKYEVLQVLRVDPEKKYVDLTRKNISPEEIQLCHERWASAKKVHSIIAHVVEVTKQLNIADFYTNLVWPLEKSGKFTNALEGFKAATTDLTILADYNIPEEAKQILQKSIVHRLSSKNNKVLAEVEVTCFTADGIDSIIPSLQAAKSVNKDIQVSIISPPLYSISTNTSDAEEGVKTLNCAIDAIKSEIEKRQGSLTIKRQPVCV